MATQAQLVSHVLWRLRARASGQTPLTEDSNDVATVVPWKVEDLNARKVFYLADTDDIPNGAVLWLARLIEYEIAASFGQPESPDTVKYAEAMLRVQQGSAPTETLATDYF